MMLVVLTAEPSRSHLTDRPFGSTAMLTEMSSHSKRGVDCVAQPFPKYLGSEGRMNATPGVLHYTLRFSCFREAETTHNMNQCPIMFNHKPLPLQSDIHLFAI